MTVIRNKRDQLLRAAAQRVLNPPNADIMLTATASGFHVNAAGESDPISIMVYATLVDLEGDVEFSCPNGTLTAITARSATLTYANVTTLPAAVTARVIANGEEFSKTYHITKIQDGLPGQTGEGSVGARGAGSFYVSGDSWSDIAAEMATPGGSVLDDQVTIWNGTNFAEVRRWNGSAWVQTGAHFPGDVIIPGTMTGNRIRAGTLELFKPDGTPIITLGGLQTGFEAPGTKNSDITLPSLGQNTFRAVAIGTDSISHPSTPGFYRNGAYINGVARSYTLQVIRRSDGALLSFQTYDVYGNGSDANGRNAATLASDLNALGPDKIVVVYTYDEPANYRDAGGLPAAMYRCGASRSIFGSPLFRYRSAYILVGIPGCGEGNGAEAYRGDVNSDPNAWCDVGFSLANGVVTGITGASSVGNLVNVGLINAQATADAANAALPGINTAIAAKLSKTGNEEIYGQKSLMSQYALLVGTTNDGIIYGSTGLYGRKAGKTTVSIGADGTAIFSDQLMAAWGTFGAVSIAPGGSLGIGSTGYNTDPGIWFGVVNGVPKMSICSANGTSLLFNGSTLAVLGDITARSFSTTGGRFTANTAGEVRADLVDINRRLVMQTGTLDAAEVISGTYYNAADAAYYNYPPGTVLKVDIAQVVLTDIYDFNVYATNANQPYYVAAYFDGPTTRNSSGWNGASVQFILNAKAESIRTYSNTGNYGDNTRVCITFTVTIKFIEGSVSSFKLPLAKWILYKL